MKFPIYASAGIILTLASFGLVSTASTASAAGHGLTASPPRFYLETGFAKQGPGSDQGVVRARATGAITGTFRCPRPLRVTGLAAADNQVFFLQCSRFTAGAPYQAIRTSLFRFTVTGAGQVKPLTGVPGGIFSGGLSGLSASADGKVLAFELIGKTAAQDMVEVLNVGTGATASWTGGVMPGGEIFTGGQTSLTANGKELAVFGQAHCPKGSQPGTCKSPGEEMRVVRPALTGGFLASGRQVFRQPQLTKTSEGFVNDAFISPDGSTATAGVVFGAPSGSYVEALSVSAATGKPRKVLFKLRTGNGFSYRLVTADPSGRWLLFDAGPATGSVNGWVDNGRLVRLKPAGDSLWQEAWSS